MEFHLKQWRSQKQQQHEQQASAKIPRLLLDSPHLHQHNNPSVASDSQSEPVDSALQLFVSPPSNPKISSHMSPCPHQHIPSAPTAATPPRMRGYFSLAQWQELEHQALIFRHMQDGVAVPSELLQPIIKKSLLLDVYPHYLHNSLLQHPALMQSGYWGKAALDPEPGRCRRTDGKKWRCSREVVAGHKYCERHVHRGRNRSRKHVEVPTAGVAAAGNVASPAAVAPAATAGRPFALSERLPSAEILHLHPHPRPSESVADRGLFGGRREVGRSDGQMLRSFFDDWPRTLSAEADRATPAAAAAVSSAATSLTISIRPSSDTSLTLSTGNDGGEMSRQLAPNWGPGWVSNQVSSMGGGPLAEALRSSVTSSSSPTSVLQQPPRCTAPRASYVT